jgi:hypothetical protein
LPLEVPVTKQAGTAVPHWVELAPDGEAGKAVVVTETVLAAASGQPAAVNIPL